MTRAHDDLGVINRVENFMEVAKVDDVPPGSATVVDVKGVEIALINSGGNFHAIGNECTHAGASLGEGDLIEDNQRHATVNSTMH